MEFVRMTTITKPIERPIPYYFNPFSMIRSRSIVFVLLILALTVTSCTAAESPKHDVGSILEEWQGSFNPFYNYYVILDVEADPDNADTNYGMAWTYTVLRVHEYPSGGWYALSSEQPIKADELGMHMDSGYSWYETGISINVNSLPRESTIIRLPAPKYQINDVVQMRGYYNSDGGLVYSGKNSGTYSLITGYDTSYEGDIGVYYSCEIRKKADGSFGYVLENQYRREAWSYHKREFEGGVIQLVTHLPDEQGIEFVDKFPTVVPITTVAPVITTLKPIQIDTPKGPSTLPPTPVRTEGPSANPFYPVTSPTPVTIQPGVVQPISPVSVQPDLVSPIAVSPTIQPKPGFGKRYAVGNPGSFLGTKYGSGGTSTDTKGSRRVTTTDAVLKPGSRSYGLTPPKGQFVRWYPAARWGAGIK